MGTSDFIKHYILRKINQGEEDIWIASIAYLNDKGWQLGWGKKDDEWHLYSWNKSIFFSNKWLAIQSFVYGMLLSVLRTLSRVDFPPLNFDHPLENIRLLENLSIKAVFDELVSVNRQILKYETRFATPGRAKLIYGVYRTKQYEPSQAQDFGQFSTFYERKLTLEKTLKSLSKEGVAHLKSAAKELEPIKLGQDERLPIVLAFLFLYLENDSSSWYQADDKWYYLEGDQLIFTGDDRDDFEAFVLGMAYNYAKLPDRFLEQYIKGSLRDRLDT